MISPDRQLLEQLAREGPQPSDYGPFNDVLQRSFRSGNKQANYAEIRDILANCLTTNTLQGLALHKPHGYAGDFEIIDKIYMEHRCEDERMRRWDDFFHAQTATRAVRNRKRYFHGILDNMPNTHAPASVLNVASGPARCVHEWLSRDTDRKITFDCIDNDLSAIQYAAKLNADHPGRAFFAKANVFRFETHRRYELIWVAGLCDYFDDDGFITLIKLLTQMVAPHGQLVLGNFSTQNPSRPYMEVIGDWNLEHRSKERLLSLAQRAGITSDRVFVDSEPEGVNLFLHINSPQSGTDSTLTDTPSVCFA